MPKSATVLSYHDRLVEHAAAVLRPLGATYSTLAGGHVHLQRRGGIFLLYEWALSDLDREELAPDSVANGVCVPDLARVSAYIAECRDERWFTEVIAHVAATVDEPIWVLDSGSRLWRASAIDASKLEL
jgi:hypothetical protein